MRRKALVAFIAGWLLATALDWGTIFIWFALGFVLGFLTGGTVAR